MGHWRAIHLPRVNPHPSNSLVHFILSEQEMISSCRLGPSWAEMCTKRDRVKLINSGTLSVDFINIDVCAATFFFCIFFHLFQSKEGQAKRLLCVKSLLFKESKKHAFVFICHNKQGSHQNTSVWQSAFLGGQCHGFRWKGRYQIQNMGWEWERSAVGA